MNAFTISVILALSVSADALACGFGAGASRIKVPLISAAAAAAVSAAFVAFGMAAGALSAPYLPDNIQKYISFVVLAVFGLIKLADFGEKPPFADFNSDKKLSAGEGAALGAALSVDGLAAGFGSMAELTQIIYSALFTFMFTAVALYVGAKGGRGVSAGRLGNIAAGLALTVLAAEKLVCG